MTSLSEYIAERGDESCARLWGVKPRTVMSWRLGQRQPRPKQAAVILAKSRGELSYESIYRAPRVRAA